MIHSFRYRASAVFGAVILAASACGSGDGPAAGNPRRRSSAQEGQAARPSRSENPFLRPGYEPRREACVSARLEAYSGRITAVRFANRCAHSVAVLTAPLEVRVRRSSTEAFVNERMLGAAYAILYVVAAELGTNAFRGDGVVRDGRLPVRQPPEYVSFGGGETVTVRIDCKLDVPPGRYFFSLWTFEIPLEDAPERDGVFSCAESVVRWNRDFGNAAEIHLSWSASQVFAGSPIVDLSDRSR